MDSDFSVRNEVDSIRPPQGEDFSYNHENSSYDEIVKNIKNAPPFPVLSPSYSFPGGLNPCDVTFHQLSLLVRQQEKINDQINNLLQQSLIFSWKHIAFLLGIVVLFLMIKPRFSRNPNYREIYSYLDKDFPS